MRPCGELEGGVLVSLYQRAGMQPDSQCDGVIVVVISEHGELLARVSR